MTGRLQHLHAQQGSSAGSQHSHAQAQARYTETPLGGVTLHAFHDPSIDRRNADTFVLKNGRPRESGVRVLRHQTSPAVALAFSAAASVLVAILTFMFVLRIERMQREGADERATASAPTFASRPVAAVDSLPSVPTVATVAGDHSIRFVPTADVFTPPDAHAPAPVAIATVATVATVGAVSPMAQPAQVAQPTQPAQPHTSVRKARKTR